MRLHQSLFFQVFFVLLSLLPFLLFIVILLPAFASAFVLDFAVVLAVAFANFGCLSWNLGSRQPPLEHRPACHVFGVRCFSGRVAAHVCL